MIEALRVLLDESVILLIALGLFIWLVRRRPTRAVIAALLLLVLFDLGRYYHLTLRKTGLAMKNMQVFRTTPPAYPQYISVPEGEVASTYIDIISKRPLLDMKGVNLIEFKDYFDYVNKDKQWLYQTRQNTDAMLRLRLVGKPAWDEFLSQRPYSLATRLEPASSSIAATSFSADSISISVSTPQAAYVYYQDNYDKGWSATVDGAPATLIDAKPFKAVEVAAGAHTVTMSYLPPWRWALMLVLNVFALGAGACVLWLYRGWLRGAR